jgi:hypothetical protein
LVGKRGVRQNGFAQRGDCTVGVEFVKQLFGSGDEKREMRVGGASLPTIIDRICNLAQLRMLLKEITAREKQQNRMQQTWEKKSDVSAWSRFPLLSTSYLRPLVSTRKQKARESQGGKHFLNKAATSWSRGLSLPATQSPTA